MGYWVIMSLINFAFLYFVVLSFFNIERVMIPCIALYALVIVKIIPKWLLVLQIIIFIWLNINCPYVRDLMY